MPDPRNELPRVSDYVVEPETNFELFEGEIRECLPANPEHSSQHAAVVAVLSVYKAPGYMVDVDLLTRQSKDNNFASDSCLRRVGMDPETRDRYLEEVAFEIKATQRPGDLKKRARIMARRGVRRIFAIPVKPGAGGAVLAGPLLEWRGEEDEWEALAADGVLEDRSLCRPLPVAALLDAVEGDRAMAAAVLASASPVVAEYTEKTIRKAKDEGKREGMREGKLEGMREGKLEGMRELLLVLLEARGLDDERARARIEACTDAGLLRRWMARAANARTIGDVLGDA